MTATFIARLKKIYIYQSGVWLLRGCMVPHETVAVSAHALCTPHNHAPDYSHFVMMMIAFIQRYSPLSSRLTVLACDSTFISCKATYVGSMYVLL